MTNCPTEKLPPLLTTECNNTVLSGKDATMVGLTLSGDGEENLPSVALVNRCINQLPEYPRPLMDQKEVL